MGEVDEARDTRLGRTVAIKILAPALAGDPAFRARFDREAQTISSLSNPHICTLFDVGKDAGVDYLVLEYLDGQTLADVCRKGPVPVARAIALGLDICDARVDAAAGLAIGRRNAALARRWPRDLLSRCHPGSSLGG
jgi:eukaryotic-like serine/threonine-protein kinase